MKLPSTHTFVASLKGCFKDIVSLLGVRSGLESNDPCHSGEVRSFDFHWDKFVAKQTYGKFVEGLNKFYADERNSKIEIHHGLWVVMNILSGISGENLQMMVDAWRQKDGQSNESSRE